VYKSTDAGLTWAAANAGIASSLVSGLAVDPTNAMVVYSSTDSALLKSADAAPDPKPSNNTVTTTESIANIADLSVTVTGNATAQVGDAVSYTVVVANAGPNVAAATQLKYQLAQGMTPGSATSAGATCTSGTSGLITCAVGDLAAANP
jgi:uncharacterized repeat protein (TIGR01451 family)